MNEPVPVHDPDDVASKPSAGISGGSPEVSPALLSEAILQLRKLNAIRQRETERQERAIAQMHAALKRQSRLSRFVLLACILALLSALFSAYLGWRSHRKQATTGSSLIEVEKRLGENNEIIKSDLSAARTSQEQLARQVTEQLQTVRLERDQVRDEVRNMLDEKTRVIATREAAVQAEKDALEKTRARIREEQQSLIQQTIQQLNAMSVELQTGIEATPATQEPVTPVYESVPDAIATPEPVIPPNQ